MTSYDWATTRDDAIDRFHESPGAALEERVLAHFRETPGKVRTLIASIGVRVAEGKVHHGWAILDRELAVVVADVVADDHAERERQVMLAEAWVRNAGGYVDREDELVAALFGPAELTAPLGLLERLDAETRGNPGRHLYGPLLRAAIVETRANGPQDVPGSPGILSRFDTPQLRTRMVALWRSERPRFEACEQEAEERQARNGDNYRALRKPPPARVVEDPDAFYDTIELPEEATA